MRMIANESSALVTDVESLDTTGTTCRAGFGPVKSTFRIGGRVRRFSCRCGLGFWGVWLFAVVSLQAFAAPSTAAEMDASGEDPSAALAAPFEQLAVALEKTGRNQAAADVREWVPLLRPDCQVAFHSQNKLEISSESLSEPKVRAAFLKARQQAAAMALQYAKQAAAEGKGGEAYGLLWRAVREDPSSVEARTLLGLPAGNTGRSTVRPGRDAPQGLGWPDRSFLISQSAHFRVFSTAARKETTNLCEDLERFYEVWSQVFFDQWADSAEVCRQILQGQGVKPSGVVDVVLFGDRRAYVRAMGAENPAAQESTGFYSPEMKLTLLFAGKEADVETRYHEITHQLLQQLGTNVVGEPGLEAGFWIVEGIATYMESVRFLERDGYAAVGGWESPRLQYARGRWLVTRDPQPLRNFISEGRDTVQQREDLATWYTLSAAYAHLWMDDANKRATMLTYLRSVYQGRPQAELLISDRPPVEETDELVRFLAIEHLPTLPRLYPGSQLKLLYLGRTRITLEEIAALPPQPTLTWLDVSYLPLNEQQIQRLWGDGTALGRLSVERTATGDGLGEALARHRGLEEFDASFTPFGDLGLEKLSSLSKLKTLWLTGSKISDASVPRLIQLRSLEALDVQRTAITAGGTQRIAESRRDLELNPLQLVASPTENEPE